MTPFLHRRDVETAAATFGLDADLVEALCRVESGGHPYAFNPEPHYRYLWNVRTRQPFRALTETEIGAERPPKDFPCLAGDPDQEWWLQQASIGLMQVMGGVARERGFVKPYLLEMTRVPYNLAIGCDHLARLLQWASGDRVKALAGYNAGRGGWRSEAGQAYAVKVLAQWTALQRQTGASPA